MHHLPQWGHINRHKLHREAKEALLEVEEQLGYVRQMAGKDAKQQSDRDTDADAEESVLLEKAVGT